MAIYIGFDGGLRRINPTGVAVIQDDETTQTGFRWVGSTVLCPPAHIEVMHDRLDWMVEAIDKTFLQYKPDYAGYELAWVGKSPQVALHLGNLGGITRAVARMQHPPIPVFGYAPTVLKLHLAGNGGADKEAMIICCERYFEISLSEYENYTFENYVRGKKPDFRSHIADASAAALTVAISLRNKAQQDLLSLS